MLIYVPQRKSTIETRLPSRRLEDLVDLLTCLHILKFSCFLCDDVCVCIFTVYVLIIAFAPTCLRGCRIIVWVLPSVSVSVGSRTRHFHPTSEWESEPESTGKVRRANSLLLAGYQVLIFRILHLPFALLFATHYHPPMHSSSKLKSIPLSVPFLCTVPNGKSSRPVFAYFFSIRIFNVTLIHSHTHHPFPGRMRSQDCDFVGRPRKKTWHACLEQ
jgi:hypothetical protein